MANFEEISEAHRFTYQNNVELALQQKRARFPSTFTYQPNVKGKLAKVIDQIGTVEAEIDGPDRGDTPNVDPTVDQTWMQPRSIDTGYLAGKEDTIKGVIDYNSKHVQALTAAVQRAQDTLAVAGFFADRKSGDKGEDTVAFTPDAAVNYVAKDYVLSGAAADSGMTFEKILHGLMLLSENEVDTEMENIYLGVTTQEMEDLFKQVQFTSKDYRDKADIDQAARMVKGFMGVTFIRYKNLPTISATERRCPLYAKSGMHWGEPMPIETNVARDPSKKFRLRTYMEMYCGVCRSDEKKVIDIRSYHAS